MTAEAANSNARALYLNKLRIREESDSFEPPALINLIRATSLAPN